MQPEQTHARNTTETDFHFAWRDCHAWAVQAHLGRAWRKKRGAACKCYSGADIGNNWKQIREIKCFLLWHCENLARASGQTDRSLQFSVSGIHLDLPLLRQGDNLCRISLLATKASCFPGIHQQSVMLTVFSPGHLYILGCLHKASQATFVYAHP